MIYLDGNSLGPPLKGIESISQNVIAKEWGGKLIKGWNESNWMEQPITAVSYTHLTLPTKVYV